MPSTTASWAMLRAPRTCSSTVLMLSVKGMALTLSSAC
jgi:hypothetical protein